MTATEHSFRSGLGEPSKDEGEVRRGARSSAGGLAAATSGARLRGAVARLVEGSATPAELLAVLDELDQAGGRGRAIVEMLALKQEAAALLSAPHSEAVTSFLRDCARRIPAFREGMSTQLASLLSAAADNPLYTQSVNDFVGELLLSLERPLTPDVRALLRGLNHRVDTAARPLPREVPSRLMPEAPETPTPEPHGAVTHSAGAVAAVAVAASPEPVSAPDLEAPTAAHTSSLPSPREAPPPEAVPLPLAAAPALDEVEAPELTVSRISLSAPAAPPAPSSAAAPGPSASPDSAPPPLAPESQISIREVRSLEPLHAEPLRAEPLHAEPRAAAEELQALGIVSGGLARSSDVEAGAASAPSSDQAEETSPVTSEAMTPATAVAVQYRASRATAEMPDPVFAPLPIIPPPMAPHREPDAAPESDEDWFSRPAKSQPDEDAVVAVPTYGTSWEPLPHAVASMHPERGLTVPPPGGISDEEIVKISPDELLATVHGSRRPFLQGRPLFAILSVGAAILLYWILHVTIAPPERPLPPPKAQASAQTNSEAAGATGNAGQGALGAPEPEKAEPRMPPPATKATPKEKSAPVAAPSVQPAAQSAPRIPHHSEGSSPAPVASPPRVARSAPRSAAVNEVELVPDEPAPKPYRVEEHPTPTHGAPPSAFDAAYAELRRLPDDARGVDTAAQRVASAVSQAPKLEAQKMLARLAPTEVLAGLSAAQNSRLEPLRRSVASALRKVALGADDERAIQSLEMLGVWASSRRHGRAARSVLDTLGDEPEIMASAPRRSALDRVRKSLETTATD